VIRLEKNTLGFSRLATAVMPYRKTGSFGMRTVPVYEQLMHRTDA
jgi:hypothetical protein